MKTGRKILVAFLALWATSPAIAGSQPTISSRVPLPVREQLLGDLTFLRGLQGAGASPLFREIFGADFSGATVSDFLSSRINSIDADECDGNPATVACVIYAVSPHIVWLTESYAKFSMPQVFRLSTLVHESRHSEFDHRFHARCPIPFLDDSGRDILSRLTGVKLEGLLACDDSAAGSYGVQVEFLKNTQLHCGNCSEKMKLDADLFGRDVLNRIVTPAERLRLRKDLGL